MSAERAPRPATVAPPEDFRAALEETKREILAAIPRSAPQDPRSWRLISVVLPIVLTSLFSLFVYRVQSGIADRVDRDSKALQARLSLTQDYYRERLRIYQGIFESVSKVRDKTNTLAGSSPDDAKLDAAVSTLYHSYENNSIFLTKELRQKLTSLWMLGVKATAEDSVPASLVAQIKDGIRDVEEQMRRDLLVDELTKQQQLLETSGSATTTAAPAEQTKTP